VIWFSGQPFASVENRLLQVGWAALRTAVCAVCGATEEDFRQAYLRHSDTGETAAALWSRRPAAPGGLSLAAVAQGFDALEAARGPTAKVPVLARLLAPCTAVEAKYLVKILTGDLRIGLKEGLVEEAIALAFQADEALVRRGGLLCGHLGEVADLARRGELDRASLVPFRPLKPMLASPEPTPEAVWTRMHPEPGATGPVWVEDKYDGIRCQLHKVGTRVRLFSRDAKDITATFPELADAAQGLAGDLILDGEVLAVRGDDVLPFAELQKRLGRREGDLFLGGEIPVVYIAFDLLWRDGKVWLDEPLAVRRAQLESVTPLPEAFRLARVARAASSAEIEDAFRAARGRGHEGLMIKVPQSPYAPGRRGLAWVKLKMAFATLDCVVVAGIRT
jgi:DNA ligase-1